MTLWYLCPVHTIVCIVLYFVVSPFGAESMSTTIAPLYGLALIAALAVHLSWAAILMYIPPPPLKIFFTNIYTNASHAAGIRVHLDGADGGSKEVLNIRTLLRQLQSGRTTALHVLRSLQEWMQRRELRKLLATSERQPQLWVPVMEVGKTCTTAGKALLAPAAVKVLESPPPAPPT